MIVKVNLRPTKVVVYVTSTFDIGCTTAISLTG